MIKAPSRVRDSVVAEDGRSYGVWSRGWAKYGGASDFEIAVGIAQSAAANFGIDMLVVHRGEVLHAERGGGLCRECGSALAIHEHARDCPRRDEARQADMFARR